MQLTTNTQAFIEAEQYSSFILTNLHDGLMPSMWYRDVGDFGSGETLNIKTIGTATIQEVSEDTAINYSPIESGEVQLSITDYVGDAWYVTDKLRQDGSQIESLMAARSQESTRAIQENFETRFYEVCNSVQTDADPMAIAGFAHRLTSTEASARVQLKDLVSLKLAFDKANVPYAGRVASVDPVLAATLDNLTTITHDVSEFGAKILENGFDRDHQFLMNLYGWNLITSNRLAKGTFSDGTTQVAGAVANVFMSILDDNTKPMMATWRQMPSVEGERNKDFGRDEFVTRARWGIGAQRLDTLAIYITSATAV
jgi:hypothetical protein|tara:strand:- start:1115 stop:2053 length:939 start_codon:yes stop_codon:yes gene_type:complete